MPKAKRPKSNKGCVRTTKKSTDGLVEQVTGKVGATLWPAIIREVLVMVAKSLFEYLSS